MNNSNDIIGNRTPDLPACSAVSQPTACPIPLRWIIKKEKLTLNLQMTTIVAPPSNASKWQMGYNSAFKGLIWLRIGTSSGLLLIR